MLWTSGLFASGCDWSSLLGVETLPCGGALGDYLLLGPKVSCQSLPRLLVIPPASGHASTLMADLVAGFAGAADIYILHLQDPETRPKGSEQFGVQGQIHAISEAVKFLRSSSDQPLWCVTACQASGPTLSAISQTPPDALTLVASPINPSAEPGGAASIFTDTDPEIIFKKVQSLTRTLSNGRRVLPASVQMAAILQGQGGAARILAREAYAAFGPTTFFQSSRQMANRRRSILTDSQNIDAKLLEEALRFNFVDRPFDADKPVISGIPIFAVAGSDDKVVPAGQCHDIQSICADAKIETYTARAHDHFDLFVGKDVQQTIGPKILDFFSRVAT
jgi:poly(3-hydroxybutyrate) depolymerase